MELSAEVTGKSGHSSKPEGKVNAIFYAARLIEFINQTARDIASRRMLTHRLIHHTPACL